MLVVHRRGHRISREGSSFFNAARAVEDRFTGTIRENPQRISRCSTYEEEKEAEYFSSSFRFRRSTRCPSTMRSRPVCNDAIRRLSNRGPPPPPPPLSPLPLAASTGTTTTNYYHLHFHHLLLFFLPHHLLLLLLPLLLLYNFFLLFFLRFALSKQRRKKVGRMNDERDGDPS